MKHKHVLSACCALLLSLAGLSLSSCATPPKPVSITVSYGTPSLKRNEVIQTAQKLSPQRPATIKELSTILGGQALGTHTDKQGKYCVWQAYEESSNRGHQNAFVGCLANKSGKISKFYIEYFDRPFDHPDGPGKNVFVGDKELKDANLHPGFQKALTKPFREQQIKIGFARGQEVAFSPSGQHSYFLPRGARVIGWAGETPNIQYPQQQEQPQQEEQQQQQDTGSSIIDTTNTVLRLIEIFS